MFTIFSIPKPFIDPHISIIQTNAIKSWFNVSSDIEVILCGNDFGVKEICQKNNIQHIANVECTESGTPLLNSVFNLVRKQAKYDIIIYINADIIITSDFLKIFNFLPPEDFLIVGRRWDLNITELLDFSKNWEEDINKMIKKEGRLHAQAGSDYFIFRKGLFKNLPPFAVGRIGWDNWMLQESFDKNILVIDATPLAKVIHQNHDYRHKVENLKQEDKKNISLTGIAKFLPTLRNVKYEFRSNGIKKRIVFFNNFNQIIKKNIYNFMINLKKSLVGLIRIILKPLKNPLLRFIKPWNALLRKIISKSHKIQMQIEWGIPTNPEWFDHYEDLYYLWGHENKNSFWLERGVFSSLAVKEHANILELCCGDGFNAQHFYAPKAVKVVAVDFDESAIKHARKYNQSPNIQYDVKDIRSDMPGGEFDNIVWDAAIKHFTENEIAALMKTIKSRLKVGGVLSGYTIVERAGGKSLAQHEYEFKDKKDLLRFLEPYFANVIVFETIFPERHNLYFYASDGILPFTEKWDKIIYSLKD